MPKFEKGSKEAKAFMAKLRSMRGKGIPDDEFYKVKAPITTLPVKKKPIRKPVDFLGSNPETWSPVGHSGSDSADVIHQEHMGSGLYAGGSVGSIVDDGIDQARNFFGNGIAPLSRSYGSPPMMGFGVHHHHYHMDGTGMWDWANPKKNGIAKIFDPKQNGAEKVFTKDLPSALIHKALPAVVGSVAGTATTALTGNPYAGFVAGQTLGKYAGKKAGDALGDATGYGLGLGLKPGHLIKGSKEAKEYMVSIRAKRG